MKIVSTPQLIIKIDYLFQLKISYKLNKKSPLIRGLNNFNKNIDFTLKELL